MEYAGKLILLSLVLLVVIFFVVRAVLFGWRRAIFTPGVLKTMGEIRLGGSRKTRMRVHVLDSTDPETAIGFDLLTPATRFYLHCSPEEAQELIELFQLAINQQAPKSR